MKTIREMVLSRIAKSAYNTARKEVDSACFCFGYQPVMPQKVKDMKKKK